MSTETRVRAIRALACTVTLAWAESAGAQLFIGTLSNAKPPDGFTVEDARPESAKTSSHKETYRRSALSFSTRGPAAKYRRNFGDEDLSARPVDLLAERFVQRYGDKLKGKKLVVEEFSVVTEETVQKENTGTASRPGMPAGAAVVGALTAATLQSMLGPGTSVSLKVTIAASLDGKRVDGSDFGSIVLRSPPDVAAKIVDQALDIAFYRYEQADGQAKGASPAPAPEKRDPADAAQPPADAAR